MTTTDPEPAALPVSTERRLCTRPGCSTPAAATMRFRPTARVAWLYDLDHSGVRTEADLCARHAVALSLPRGWVLHDQRGTGTAPPSAGAWRRVASVPVTPTAHPAARDAAIVTNDDTADELAETLDARTPLLQRAFRNVSPVPREQ